MTSLDQSELLNSSWASAADGLSMDNPDKIRGVVTQHCAAIEEELRRGKDKDSRLIDENFESLVDIFGFLTEHGQAGIELRDEQVALHEKSEALHDFLKDIVWAIDVNEAEIDEQPQQSNPEGVQWLDNFIDHIHHMMSPEGREKTRRHQQQQQRNILTSQFLYLSSKYTGITEKRVKQGFDQLRMSFEEAGEQELWDKHVREYYTQNKGKIPLTVFNVPQYDPKNVLHDEEEPTDPASTISLDYE